MLHPGSEVADIELLVEPEGEKALFTADTKGELPPGTQELRHIDGVSNGQCRFACHEESVCSGYKWTGSTNECTLLEAPSHLKSAAANSAWHEGAAKISGVPFVPDPAELEMVKMAEKLAAEAKEDERRGKLGIDVNEKEAIQKVKDAKKAKINMATTPEEVKKAATEAKFTIAQIKKFVATHRAKFEGNVEKLVQYYAHEKAKEELRKPETVQKLAQQDWKDFDSLILDTTNQMKRVVKGHVARSETREFLREMDQYVLGKVTEYKENLLAKKAAKETAVKKAEQLVEAKKKAKVEVKQTKKQIEDKEKEKAKHDAEAEEKKAESEKQLQKGAELSKTAEELKTSAKDLDDKSKAAATPEEKSKLTGQAAETAQKADEAQKAANEQIKTGKDKENAAQSAKKAAKKNAEEIKKSQEKVEEAKKVIASKP
jgi:hypothetical protein